MESGSSIVALCIRPDQSGHNWYHNQVHPKILSWEAVENIEETTHFKNPTGERDQILFSSSMNFKLNGSPQINEIVRYNETCN